MGPFRFLLSISLATVSLASLIWLGQVSAQPGPPPERIPKLPAEFGHIKDASTSLLNPATEVSLIDLASALRLAGVRNPQILLARERILEATALRQLAAAQLLPSLHAGSSFNNHNGNYLPSNGTITKVDRSSYYVGAGALAVGGGTVNIPGIAWNGNVSDVIGRALEARQQVRRSVLTERAVQNAMLLRIGTGYIQLVRSESRRAASALTLGDATEVARLTDAYAKTGQGRQADADRAMAERLHQEALLRQTEGEVLTAAARLAALLDLPPVPRLHPVEERAVPSPVVPDPIPLPELLAIASLNRPELQEQQAAIRQAMIALDRVKLLPFSPTIMVGLSYGAEGGGGNVAAQPVGVGNGAGAPRLSGLDFERADLDAAMYWSAQNLGVGNLAMVQGMRSNLAAANLELVRRLNDVRAEVAIAYARTRARLARIDSCQQAVAAIQVGFGEDLLLIKGGQGLPIELLNSLRLLLRARLAYVDAIMDFNQAQMELFVALGQPPADVLARPAPGEVKGGKR